MLILISLPLILTTSQTLVELVENVLWTSISNTHTKLLSSKKEEKEELVF